MQSEKKKWKRPEVKIMEGNRNHFFNHESYESKKQKIVNIEVGEISLIWKGEDWKKGECKT